MDRIRHGNGWLVSHPGRISSPETNEEAAGYLWSLVLPDPVLPPQTLRFPLCEEPYSAWGDDCDAFLFARDLFDFESTVIAFDGTHGRINAPWVEDVFIGTQRERLTKVLENFNASAAGLDLRDDRELGTALKYDVAWRALEDLVLQEALFFSLPHLLEAARDLDCALLLAAKGFYKQSLQVLRSFVESAVMPLHFSLDEKAFIDWREGKYRGRPLRGKRGVLMQLFANGLIDRALADDVSHVYGTMNGAVHGAEANLAHTGIFEGRDTRPGFSLERLHDWTTLYRATADAGIRLLVRSVVTWSSAKPPDVLCSTCHNSDRDRFDVGCLEFGGCFFDRLECQRCATVRIRPVNLAAGLPPFEWEFAGIYFTRERTVV